MAQPYNPNSMGGGGQMGGMQPMGQPMGGMPGDYMVEVSAFPCSSGTFSHSCRLTLSSRLSCSPPPKLLPNLTIHLL